ncbi:MULTISPECIES: hypothetical protein [unclassified Plantactinospora]|uniref:hypothetical protein n=1 Tax=unclassified Plantactinospora TaxID=2631981 RepID=UPI000D172F37|nr:MULTISPECIES: hypothetical protein [unclassified Plantactinospora]AVT28276.1 hypothetical protein C6361_00805 [Plantactinospora sp. BC1]AVT38486.1 hypothetical protein C6W10_20850 [Plantactinospora sp. BB1]
MLDDVVLVDPWWDLRGPGDSEQRQVQEISTELVQETSRGHPLYGVAFTVVGRSDATDDVLLRVGDRWALVHLTWSGTAELPPWPSCAFFDSADDAQRAIALG